MLIIYLQTNNLKIGLLFLFVLLIPAVAGWTIYQLLPFYDQPENDQSESLHSAIASIDKNGRED